MHKIIWVWCFLHPCKRFQTDYWVFLGNICEKYINYYKIKMNVCLQFTPLYLTTCIITSCCSLGAFWATRVSDLEVGLAWLWILTVWRSHGGNKQAASITKIYRNRINIFSFCLEQTARDPEWVQNKWLSYSFPPSLIASVKQLKKQKVPDARHAGKDRWFPMTYTSVDY